MINLNLQEPTEEQLLAALKEAQKSRELLEDENFQWWVDKLTKGVEKYHKKLVKDDDPKEFYRHQGSIRAIRMSLEELRFRANQVEAIEERLKLYDERTEPVQRGA